MGLHLSVARDQSKINGLISDLESFSGRVENRRIKHSFKNDLEEIKRMSVAVNDFAMTKSYSKLMNSIQMLKKNISPREQAELNTILSAYTPEDKPVANEEVGRFRKIESNIEKIVNFIFAENITDRFNSSISEGVCFGLTNGYISACLSEQTTPGSLDNFFNRMELVSQKSWKVEQFLPFHNPQSQSVHSSHHNITNAIKSAKQCWMSFQEDYKHKNPDNSLKDLFFSKFRLAYPDSFHLLELQPWVEQLVYAQYPAAVSPPDYGQSVSQSIEKSSEQLHSAALSQPSEDIKPVVQGSEPLLVSTDRRGLSRFLNNIATICRKDEKEHHFTIKTSDHIFAISARPRRSQNAGRQIYPIELTIFDQNIPDLESTFILPGKDGNESATEALYCSLLNTDGTDNLVPFTIAEFTRAKGSNKVINKTLQNVLAGIEHRVPAAYKKGERSCLSIAVMSGVSVDQLDVFLQSLKHGRQGIINEEIKNGYDSIKNAIKKHDINMINYLFRITGRIYDKKIIKTISDCALSYGDEAVYKSVKNNLIKEKDSAVDKGMVFKKAVCSGSVDMVRSIVSDFKYSGKDVSSMLELFGHEATADVVSYLMDKFHIVLPASAFINSDSGLLMKSISRGNENVTKLLLEHHRKNNMHFSPGPGLLKMAFNRGSVNIFYALINMGNHFNGISKNTVSLLMQAFGNDNKTMVNYLLSNQDKIKYLSEVELLLLEMAITHNKVDFADRIMNKNMGSEVSYINNLHEDERNLLHLAVSHEQFDLVKLMLSDLQGFKKISHKQKDLLYFSISKGLSALALRLLKPNTLATVNHVPLQQAIFQGNQAQAMHLLSVSTGRNQPRPVYAQGYTETMKRSVKSIRHVKDMDRKKAVKKQPVEQYFARTKSVAPEPAERLSKLPRPYNASVQERKHHQKLTGNQVSRPRETAGKSRDFNRETVNSNALKKNELQRFFNGEGAVCLDFLSPSVLRALLADNSGQYGPVMDFFLQNQSLLLRTRRIGWSPLTLSAMQGNLGVTHFFIQHGAKVNHIDRQGELLLHKIVTSRTRTGNTSAIIDMLRRAGARD